MIRTAESKIFESAFFILRASAGEKRSEVEMVAEAGRIIAECNLPKRKKRVENFRHIMLVVGISFLLGAVTVGAAWIMTSMR